MEAISSKLKSAREAKNLTLADISEATLIEEKFLQAIEDGNMSVLPQTYMRAFIRAYAKVVGLDPTEMMHLLDGSPPPAAPPQEKPEAPTPPLPDHDDSSRLKTQMRNGVLVLLVLALISVGIWNLTQHEPEQPVAEVPFQSVVKEHERKSVGDTVASKDSSTTQPAQVAKDSLILSATTSDSVWMRIVLDGKEAREYLFKPNATISWKALEQFEVSLGNAGVMEFTLNGQKFGTLGKRGAVVRGVMLNRTSITKN